MWGVEFVHFLKITSFSDNEVGVHQRFPTAGPYLTASMLAPWAPPMSVRPLGHLMYAWMGEKKSKNKKMGSINQTLKPNI